MRRSGPFGLTTSVVLIALLSITSASGPSLAVTALAQTMPMPMGSASCEVPQVAFCDTFDQPFTGGGRTGQLDPSRWSVARVSGINNPGENIDDKWVPTDAMHCKNRVSGVVP